MPPTGPAAVQSPDPSGSTPLTRAPANQEPLSRALRHAGFRALLTWLLEQEMPPGALRCWPRSLALAGLAALVRGTAAMQSCLITALSELGSGLFTALVGQHLKGRQFSLKLSGDLLGRLLETVCGMVADEHQRKPLVLRALRRFWRRVAKVSSDSARFKHHAELMSGTAARFGSLLADFPQYSTREYRHLLDGLLDGRGVAARLEKLAMLVTGRTAEGARAWPRWSAMAPRQLRRVAAAYAALEPGGARWSAVEAAANAAAGDGAHQYRTTPPSNRHGHSNSHPSYWAHRRPHAPSLQDFRRHVGDGCWEAYVRAHRNCCGILACAPLARRAARRVKWDADPRVDPRLNTTQAEAAAPLDVQLAAAAAAAEAAANGAAALAAAKGAVAQARLASRSVQIEPLGPEHQKLGAAARERLIKMRTKERRLGMVLAATAEAEVARQEAGFLRVVAARLARHLAVRRWGAADVERWSAGAAARKGGRKAARKAARAATEASTVLLLAHYQVFGGYCAAAEARAAAEAPPIDAAKCHVYDFSYDYERAVARRQRALLRDMHRAVAADAGATAAAGAAIAQQLASYRPPIGLTAAASYLSRALAPLEPCLGPS